MVRPAAIDWVLPPALGPGAVVGVCAPAGPVRPARFVRGLALLARHLTLRVPDGLTEAQGDYLAGSDQRRADELTALLVDPDVRAIILARGGYGLTRMLARVDPALLARDPKPLVGFSDATALMAWAALAGVRPIHGPVVSQLGDLPPEDVAALVARLTDPRPPGRIATLAPLTGARGFAGPLIAANLKMLAHLVGTPWVIDAAGGVLLIEEIGEKPYAIDRDLTQLDLAGLLRGARGVIAGDLIRCTEPPSAAGSADDPGPARAAVAERLAAFGLPAWSGAPIGHGARNLSVPFGARVEVDDDGAMAIVEGAVA